MRYLYFVGVCICLSISILSCKKTSDKHPDQSIQNPVGTWVLIRTGVQAGDGTYNKWVWKEVEPTQAYKITFKEDNSFESFKSTPSMTGTYTFAHDSIKVVLPDDKRDFPMGRIMQGTLKSNIIDLRYLVGADGATGLQFRLLQQNETT